MLYLHSKMIKMLKKKREFPNTYVIISAVILLAAIATWLVPGGEYVEVASPIVEGSELLAEDIAATASSTAMEFRSVDSNPQSWQIMTALYKGFTSQAGIIIFILIIGGAFWIVNSSKAIDIGICSFLKKIERLETNILLKKIGVNNLVLILIILLFSTFGAVFGMSEEAIAFVIVIVPLAISMGYDSIVGVCLVYVAAHVGFAGAFLNPFTIGVAQDIAGLPLFSGMPYRLLCWTVLNVIMIIFILLYARKVKNNPTSSPMYKADAYWRERVSDSSAHPEQYRNRSSWWAFGIAAVVMIAFTIGFSENTFINIGDTKYYCPYLLPMASGLFIVASILTLRKSVHFFILNLLAFTIVFLVIGVLAFSWYIAELSALFLALGVLSGIAVGYSPNNLVKEFLNGAKDMLSAAVIVGLAAGIIIILKEGRIIDTMLHSMASALGSASQSASLALMYGIQTLINIVIPSATAKAAITIPIMAPFADIIGLSRQATILAFQFGDGFTNMITPTSGVLMAALGLARVPYSVWVKWIWRFILVLIVLGFLLLLPTVFLDLAGF